MLPGPQPSSPSIPQPMSELDTTKSHKTAVAELDDRGSMGSRYLGQSPIEVPAREIEK